MSTPASEEAPALAGGVRPGGRQRTSPEGGGESYVLRVPPELRSVGLARSKLTELALPWGTPPEVLDDARVVLSELMSNGVLHARTELEVVMSQRGSGLRLEVHDASAVPLVPPLQPIAIGSLLASPDEMEGTDVPATPAATGRGLSMVAALVTTWGWFSDASGGKVVWAEIGTIAADAPGGDRSAAPSGFSLRPVRLIAVPLRLLKASEDHFDDLFRELQMANLAGPSPVPSPAAVPAGGGRATVATLAPLAESVKSRLARMREPVRRALWDAARKGDRLLDLNLLADAGVPGVFEMVEQLLARAGAAARRGLLLTEPPSPEVGEWRRWVRKELELQIAGKPPRACPFPVSPVVEGAAGAAWQAQDVARDQALASLRALFEEMAESTGVDERREAAPGLAEDVVMVHGLAKTVEFVGARRSVLCLLAEDNETVRFGASVGFSPDVADYWQATSLSGDLPSSEAIRTDRPVLFRTFAELDARYPVFLSTPSESDPALACVPLRAPPGGAFGCLVLGFPQARDFNPREVAFLGQLADEVAHSILGRRAHIEEPLSVKRDTQMGAATAAIMGARGRDEVLRVLVETVVAILCDGASVHVVEGRSAVRYLMTRHRDPDRLGAAVSLLQKRQYQNEAGSGDDMIAECVRTGQRSVVQSLSDEAISAGAIDEEDRVLLRRVGLGAVGVMPVLGEGAVVAVLSFGNSVGRFITDRELAALELLTATAGRALAQLGP